MTKLGVWAPRAKRVELALSQRRAPMARDDDGWWQGPAMDVRAGDDYAFAVDGGDPLPDPRSPWQPRGVHEASRVVDHASFDWTDAGWQPPDLATGIIYELHIGTFTAAGTFVAAIDRLDHLVDLGVTHVEIMPVNEFSGSRGWGYDGVDLYAPHHAYGGPDGMKQLVNACHSKGLAVLLDVVYNHLGPSGNYLARFGPYFTSRFRTPWGDAVNFDDRGSLEVRRFVIDNALGWLRDYHLDGLRIDAVHAIADTSAIHILEELAAEVRALESEIGRKLLLIAESDLNDPRLIRSTDAGGYGLDAQWNEDFHHALHAVLTKERSGYYADFGSLADLAKALEQAFVYDGCYSVYRERKHGRPAVDLSGDRFVGCLQNHDQIGNRAKGERMSHLVDTERLKIGAALVLLSPFVPMLFQGEEWGATSPFLYFTDHQEPELAEAVRKGRRSEFAAFGWKPEDIPDPQAPETFERSKLDWSELGREPHGDLLEWHRALIRLRREIPELTNGRLDRVHVQFDENERWLAVQRGGVVIACNLSERDQMMPLPEAAGTQVKLASSSRVAVQSGAIELPAAAVAIVA